MYLSIISALNVFALSLCAGIEFNPHAFIDNLPYMAKGMLDKARRVKKHGGLIFYIFKILLRVILTSKIKHDTIKLKKILKCQIPLIKINQLYNTHQVVLNRK